jgi:hypothetical protein
MTQGSRWQPVAEMYGLGAPGRTRTCCPGLEDRFLSFRIAPFLGQVATMFCEPGIGDELYGMSGLALDS